MSGLLDSSQKTKPNNKWPDYLDNSLLEVLNNTLHFKTMTPVQVKSKKYNFHVSDVLAIEIFFGI